MAITNMDSPLFDTASKEKMIWSDSQMALFKETDSNYVVLLYLMNKLQGGPLRSISIGPMLRNIDWTNLDHLTTVISIIKCDMARRELNSSYRCEVDRII